MKSEFFYNRIKRSFCLFFFGFLCIIERSDSGPAGNPRAPEKSALEDLMMRIADMHCDTIYEIYERRAKGEECGILENSLHIDLGKMKRGDYLLQNFALSGSDRDRKVLSGH